MSVSFHAEVNAVGGAKLATQNVVEGAGHALNEEREESFDRAEFANDWWNDEG